MLVRFILMRAPYPAHFADFSFFFFFFLSPFSLFLFFSPTSLEETGDVP